MFATGAAS